MPTIMMSVILLELMIVVTLLVQDWSASELFKKHPSYFNIKYKTIT